MIFMVALTLGGMNTACTDWDDHYDEATSSVGSSASSLWQNIASNSNLSQFAALLQKTGYDKVLDADQTYTVWAPMNGTFDYETLMEVDNDRLLREFIQNHIARNNYPASGKIDESVFMLNEKVLKFDGDGEYTFGNIALQTANYMPSSNGVVHLLSQEVPFRFNIYESLTTDVFDIGLISEYYHSYDQKILNEEKSVQGPPVEGKITYLDEVYDETNALYSLYWSYINREDSNYTMLVPTDEAWTKAKEKIETYYHYIDHFDYVANTKTGSERKVEPITIDSEYLKDSIVSYNIMSNLFFNNNLYDNKKLNDFQPGSDFKADSLVSTTFSIFYKEDAERLFDDATRVDKSNGAIFVTNTLNMHPWLSWCPEIKIEGESSSNFANQVNGEIIYGSVSATNMNPNIEGRVSNNRFIYLEPTTLNGRPQIHYYIPGVRSTTYCVYVVTVPANIFNPNETKLLPSRYQVYVNINTPVTDKDQNVNGQIQRVNIGTVENTGTAIDTTYVGDVTFPIAYYGTGYSPFLEVAVRANDSKHDPTLRIDCIMLVPKELDDYKKAHPDYKYYQGGGIFYM